MSKTIFIVTTMSYSFYQSQRAVGFFHKKEDAISAVTHNDSDIHEGSYPYVVIEEKSQGFYTIPFIELWYRWDRETESYIECSKPEKFKKCVSFGLG
jgi:hypothetical protein